MSDALDDLELNDDEKQRQPLSPRIAPPNVASGALPPMNLRGLPPPATSEATPATGSTADLENHVATRVIPPPIAKPSPLETRTSADQAELGRLRTTGSGISQVARAHPIAGGILRGLNIAGSVASGIIPGLHPLMNSIPGTEEHHNYLERQATGKIGEDLGEEKDEAAKAKSEADTDEAGTRSTENLAKADLEKAQADVAGKSKEGLTPEETTIHDLMTGENGQPRINPDTQQPYTYLQAYGAVKQAAQDTKPNPDNTDKVVRIVNGVPHEILIDKKTGADIRDLGQTKLPGESPTDKRSAAEQTQVEREARAAIHKAEQDYNSAQSAVQMQRQLIQDAKGGNKEAVRIVPLEGALEITTSQGVHRINRTEVDQYGQAGSLFDRIMGKIGSGVSGKNIPDDVLKDMDAMTEELGKNAYGRYKREYEYNKQVVEGYGGKDFDKRVPMLPQEKAGAGEGAGAAHGAKKWDPVKGVYE